MNYGKMSMKEVPPPEGMALSRAYVLVNSEGVRWQDIAPPKRDGAWICAVDDNGYIRTCDADPLSLAMVGMDIWLIESDLPRDSIFTHKWNGTEVVE